MKLFLEDDLSICRKIGLGLTLAATLGAVYLLRKRSRPLGDPWAEEYWANLSAPDDLPNLPVETASNTDSAVPSASTFTAGTASADDITNAN